VHDPSAPMRLPQNILSIVIATVIACSGYAIFAVRFGDPVRKAKAAVVELRQAQEKLDQQAVTIARQAVADEMVRSPGRSSDVMDQLSRFEEELRAAHGVAEAARRETDALRAAVRRLRVEGVPVAGADSAARLGAGAVSTTPQTAAQPEQPALSAPVMVDRHQGVRLEVVAARVSRDRFVLELVALKETPGDGYLHLWGPRAKNGTRVITAEGLTLFKGKVKLAGTRYGSWGEGVDLRSGIPVRFEMSFDGSVSSGAVIPIIEIYAQFKKVRRSGSNEKVVYTYRDVIAK